MPKAHHDNPFKPLIGLLPSLLQPANRSTRRLSTLTKMKLAVISALITTFLSASGTSAHYIFTNINGNKAAVRQPVNNTPVSSVTSGDIVCNSKASATDVVKVAAGGSVSELLS